MLRTATGLILVGLLLLLLASLCGCPQKAPEPPPATTTAPPPSTPSEPAAAPKPTGKAIMLEDETMLVAAKSGGQTEIQEMADWGGGLEWQQADPVA